MSFGSRDLFKEDAAGRTSLFHAVARNDIGEVKRILYSLSGTGLGCQRQALISHRDKQGITAIDLAVELGNEEIGVLLSSELGRMEFFE